VTGTLGVVDVTVRHGKVRAVSGASFTARPGEPVAILGRNGAGKSSLLAAIAGVIRPERGTVLLDGRDISREPADRRTRGGLVLVPEGRRIFPSLTVDEHLRLGGFRSRGHDLVRRLDRVRTLFPVLEERAAAPAGQLSGGQQQMLVIARALMAAPTVLVLDEPSLGLAPRAVAEVYTRLETLRNAGMTIVLVEQQVTRALHFATEAIVLELGRIVAHEPAATLAGDPRLLTAYLGRRPG